MTRFEKYHMDAVETHSFWSVSLDNHGRLGFDLSLFIRYRSYVSSNISKLFELHKELNIGKSCQYVLTPAQNENY